MLVYNEKRNIGKKINIIVWKNIGREIYK